MHYANFHTHTNFSDGSASPEEYIKEALRLGMDHIGFSDHAPIPGENVNWAMSLHRLPEYITTLRTLQQTYADRIRIYIGLEIDYIPGIIHPHYAGLRFLDLDYTIGAVHFLDTFRDGKLCAIDDALTFKAGLHQIYKNDVRAAVTDYFHRIIDMLFHYPPDILAHLDRIKMHNPDRILWSEDENWYRHLVGDVLHLLKDKGVALEINTKGMYAQRKLEPYPSYWIIKEAYEMGIPLHLASDAHQASCLDKGFATVQARLSMDRIHTSHPFLKEDVIKEQRMVEAYL